MSLFDEVARERYWAFGPRIAQWAREAGTASTGGGGAADLPAGVPMIVRPGPDGSWPEVERPEGFWVWWQRAINDTLNAPIPSFRQGYVMGDLVSPPPDVSLGESLPYLGVVWSDSMATTSSAGLAGRNTDNYAGGTGPHQWGSTQGSGVAFPRVRAMSDIGLECADTGIAYIASPAVNVGQDYRVEWDVNAPSTSHHGGMILTGATETTRLTVLWVRGDSAGNVTVSVVTREPENWATVVVLGTVAVAPWARIVVTRRGPVVEVEYAGESWTHTLTGESATNPRRLAWTAGGWGTFSAKRLVFEAL